MIQRMLQNGWDEDTDGRFVKMASILCKISEQQVVDQLEAGKVIYYDTDWYAKLRIEPQSKPTVEIEKALCDCGHSTRKINVMTSAHGTCCPECYDRLSE